MDFFGFLGDVGKNVGNFFNSVFGGDDEEEKRRRREEAARKKQAQQTQARPQAKPLAQIERERRESNPLLPKPASKPTFTNIDEFMKPKADPALKKREPTNKVQALGQTYTKQKDGTYTNSAGQRRTPEQVRKFMQIEAQANRREQAIKDSPFDYAGDIIGAPAKIINDLIVKPTGEHTAEGYRKNQQRLEAEGEIRKQFGNRALLASPKMQRFQRESIDIAERDGSITKEAADRLRKELEEKVGLVSKGVADIKAESKAKYGTEVPTTSEAFWAAAIPAVEIGTIGGGAAIKSVAIKAGEKLLPYMTKAAEKTLGRTLTKEESVAVSNKVRELEEEAAEEVGRQAANVSDDVKAGAKTADEVIEQSPGKAVETPRPERPDLPSREQVVEDYKNTFNQINDDPAIPAEEKVRLQQEATQRHADMLRQLDESETAQTQVVDDAARQTQEAQAAREAEVRAQQEAVQEAQAPPPEQVVQAEPVRTPEATEQAVNNAYDGIEFAETAAMRARNESIKEAQSENPIAKMVRSIGRSTFDPLLSTARSDRLARRQAGRELLPEEQLAPQIMSANNPQQAVRAELRDSGIRQLMQKYQKDRSLEQDFETFRMYRDELWRVLENGEPQTLPVPVEEMQAFVAKQLRDNPEMAADADTFRQFALNNFRRRVEAGRDSREMYEQSARNPYYSPRVRVNPDDELRPTMTGIASRSGRGTQARTGNKAPVESPLDAYIRDLENTYITEAAGNIRNTLVNRGFRVSSSPEDAARRRDLVRDMRDLADTVRDLQKVKKGAKKELANAQSVASAKAQAVEITRNYLRAAGDSDVMADVAPLADSLTDKEALDLFDVLTDVGAKNTKRVSNKIAKDTGATPDEVKDFITGIRQEIKNTRQESSEAFEEMMGLTINPRTGKPEITVYHDGAAGKIEIPVPLFKEWQQMNKILQKSPVGRVVAATSAAFRNTWTGALNFGFNMIQPVMNQGVMFLNSRGFSSYRPEAIAQFFKSALMADLRGGSASGQFRSQLQKAGMQLETASKGVLLKRSLADDIAATSGMKNFFLRNPARTLGDVGRGMNRALAHISNAQRMQVARGAYSKARGQGYTHEQAIQIAAQAPVQVFGDFNRVSQFARTLDDTSLLPYAGATQAGLRASVEAAMRNPAEYAGKMAALVGSIAGLTAWNLENGAAEYYDQMERQGTTTDDNSMVIALGQVSQNEDGSWNNLIKVPFTPDYRPLMRGAVDSVRSVAKDEGLPVEVVAAEAFNFITGDVGSSIYDPKRTDEGADLAGGVLASSPIVNTGRILANRDLWNGGQVADDQVLRNPDRTAQALDNTSEAARWISQATGGAITPIQADQLLGQTSSLGKSIKDVGAGDDPVARFFDVSNRFIPSAAKSDEKVNNANYYRALDDVEREFSGQVDPKTFKLFQSYHSKKGDANKKNLLNSAQKALDYMLYTGDGTFQMSDLYKMEKALDAKLRAQGRPGNPMFDLPPEQLQRVLTYRQGKIYNAAGQNRTKSGDAAFTSLGLDNRWYENFRKAEDAYYKTVMGDGKEGDDIYSFSGEKKKSLNPEQEKVQNAYFDLKDAGDSGAARSLLNANPWLKDYWAESNDFTNEERKALGFEAVEDEYGSGGRSYSGSGGGDYEDTYNALNPILNLGDDFKRLTPQQQKEITLNLQKFFAARRGGRANVKLGASASGNPRQ